MNNATDEDYLRDEAQNDLKSVEYLKSIGLEPSTGCWIDGHWGHFGVTRLIEIAQDYGYELCDDDEKAVHAFKDWIDEFEGDCGEYHNAADWILMQGGLGDDAEEWLNENVAREGYNFGWNDGEFFYMNHNWWDDQDEDGLSQWGV